MIVWCDGVLLPQPIGPATSADDASNDVRYLPSAARVLRRYQDDGWRVLGLSWQPEVADKTMSADEVRAGFARMQKLLGLDDRSRILPARRRTTGLLVPKAAAGPRRRAHPASPARSGAVHLRRRGSAGPRLRAAARLSVSER